MEKAIVIANPAASQFTGGAHRDVMAILSRTFDVEAVWPGSANDTAAAASKLAEAGASTVIAMGGDGMVHHVAQGLVDTSASMGIIPVGTTNVIARLFEIPKSPTKAAKLIAERNPPVEVGTLRMELTRGTTTTIHHSIFACGLGLDADVVIEADKDPYRKYRFGSLHYARTAFGVALKSFPRRRPHIIVKSGDRQAEVAAILFQFREFYTYFGRLPLSLGKEAPDPVTALLVDRLRRRRVPRVAAKVFSRGELGDLPELHAWESVTGLEAFADPPVAAQADGESLGMVDAASIRWEPGSLRILGGQDSGR